MGFRVELFARIRRDARAKGFSIRSLAKAYRVSRRTVRQALEAAEPPARRISSRSSPKLDLYKHLIDRMLLADLDAPWKQRHTAQRVLDRLVDEHQAVISYSTVRQYVKARRAGIAFEAGRAPLEVFVPQEHAPGAEAEVDFGDVWIDIAGVRTRCYMFAFRLSHSGKSVHRVYPTCGQEAFLEGHLEAFNALGGVPTRHIRYDNLTSAVTKVIYGAGRQRVENERWVLFRSHFGFDAFYCEPGIKGAHEKGGVEGEVGRFRRNFLTPVPAVDSLVELNEKLRVWDPPDLPAAVDDWPGLRCRTAVTGPVAGRGLRSRPDSHTPGRQIIPGHHPFHEVLRARTIHQPQGPGIPSSYRGADLRLQDPDRLTP